MMYLLETPNYYKIGYADDIDKRMKSYNTHNPEYALIDQFKGSEFTEIDFLEKFYHTKESGMRNLI